MDYEKLSAMAAELGFARMGVCDTAAFAAQKQLVDSQQQIKERAQLRYDPQEDYTWGKALLVLLWPYETASLPQRKSDVFVDSYYAASNAAYHAAKLLEERITKFGFHAKANVSYPAKAAAVRAGLGVIGDNSLLITPDYGTKVVIILMLTDAIEAEKAIVFSGNSRCAQCGKCKAACPTGALDEKGMSHPERCLRNHMMEGTVVPSEIRSAMGQRLIGCDICQRVCPMQRTNACAGATRFTLDAFMTTDQQLYADAVSRLASEIGRNVARPQRVRAQAALISGNLKRKEDLPVLYEWAESEFPAVREHAKWAIVQIESDIQGLDQRQEKR